ncbi:MAG: ArsR family transcriptional regulator [Spirochaetaceae bacterium]|nr:MAG: ArsR family transcriptional regulator [Spirochaetaceae bacterium]
MTEAHVFKALGDPFRLTIVQRVLDGSIRGSTPTVGSLSEDLGLTRQGARRQIQVLVDAGILHLTPVGREIHVRLDTSTLETARAFIVKLASQRPCSRGRAPDAQSRR